MTLRDERLKKFQKNIGYDMVCASLLNNALTHSSYANERKGKLPHNERLEFLGDSILSLVVSEYLFQTYTDVSEGSLTKMRASAVSEPSLVNIANSIELGNFILLGKGEEATGGRKRSSILADALESVIAAIYLDGGLDQVRSFLLKRIAPIIEQTLEGKGFRDYKTELQELLQQQSDGEIEYRIVEEQGPDHDKAFVAKVFHAGVPIGNGFGKSKKEAEQQAACSALNKKQL